MSSTSTPTSTPTHTLNLHGILTESTKIVNAHSRHFLALSVLFLLPLSFTLILLPSLTTPHDVVSTHFILTTTPLYINNNILIIILIFLYTTFICSLATITYSTLHGFYGRPVKFYHALKSLVVTFLPLVATSLACLLILTLVTLTFYLCLAVVIMTSEKLCLGYISHISHYNSVYFIMLCFIIGVTLSLVMMYCLVTWSLASVIVVTESRWGFEALWRSAYLIKGMKKVALALVVVFGVLVGGLVWVCSCDVLRFGVVDGWRSWGFVLRLVVGTSGLVVVLVYGLAANTVLYMYCKALHGELAIEIAEEFAREYVCLPFDDEKVPHVVTVFPA